MRVLHIIPSYMPAYRYGGPIWSVHNLNKWLVKGGIEVTVYTTNIDGKGTLDVPAGSEVLLDGVKVYYFPITSRGWQYSRALHQALAKSISSFDIIHITSVFLSVSTLGAYYAKKFHKPYIISPRGSLMVETLKNKSLKKKVYLRVLEKKNLRGASGIHFTSDEEAKEYKDAGLPLSKSIIIPNGLDTSEFDKAVEPGLFRTKYKIPQNKKIILFLSRISWKKGFDVLISAFRLVREKIPESVLVIAGGDDEGYKRKVEEKIKECKLENDVVFTGLITGDLKIAAYKESNVFLYTPYAENFGMVVLESLYLGLQIVMTDTIGTAENVKKSQAGFVVKRDQKEAADKVIEVLTRDKKKADEVIEVGKRLVREQFAWPGIAGLWVDAYQKLLATSV